MSSLHILEIKPLPEGIIDKYVFLYSWFPFHFADVFFSHAEAFYFDEVPFVYSFLIALLGGLQTGATTMENYCFSILGISSEN